MSDSDETVRYRRAPSVILLSSDDEIDQPIQTQYATPMAQIDLNVPTSDSSLLPVIERVSPCGLAQRDYLPYTMTALNQHRLSILPIYPPVHNDNEEDQEAPFLLLSNLSSDQLSERERERRRTGTYQCQFSIAGMPDPTMSFLLQKYVTYYGSILERFNMDLAILDFNYLRLKQFMQLNQIASIRILPSGQSTNMDYHLQDEELPQLLEFFLQIDVDLFYMKTCSFRGAKPRAAHEGIFCLTMPEIHYVMEPCQRCALCYSSNHPTYAVTFNLYQKHRFVNGYESILNCPATCQTNNIIYALTCQCGDYDYIGETSGTLRQRLSSHQCTIHRLILERLIGSKNYVRFWGAKTIEMVKKDSMRLYQHVIHCPTAIQTFLNQNSAYWIFIPMPVEDADRENSYYISSSSSTTATIPALYDKNSMIHQFLLNIPKPPVNFKFSNLQLGKQYEFFLKKYYQQPTNMHYAVYRATIIAVLPLNTSNLFRQLVHSLFVTHTETKLNRLGHLFTYPLNTPFSRYVWCMNLRRPRF